MATVAQRGMASGPEPDYSVGTERAHALDRWIFFGMAAWFIALVLAGFIPSSIEKIELVRTGQRPPFPLILNMHAALMGSFLLLLLAQTWLMATGRRGYHMQLGLASFVLAPALVVVGFLVAPAIYHELWNAYQAAPPEARAKAEAAVLRSENVKLIQIRAGLLFPLFLAIGLLARKRDPGLHKRMMILATAVPLSAGIGRIPGIPTTMPASPLSGDLYILLAVLPMFLWDVVRNGRLHRAWWIWLGLFLPSSLVLNALWDTPWWHATARQMMGVG